MPDENQEDTAHDRTNIDEAVTCGIIMPISSTANHSEAHWTAVRTLITRAIENAGFSAAPVWENTSADRVSERIIGNIFRFPLMVADVSDNNPNVMLELGLRLASKKPIVVIANSAVSIPFDIRDFHALIYPPSLSILEMETFLDELSIVLKDKYQASKQEGYTPFLGDIIVDVVKPEQREVPVQQYVLDRLDEIISKINLQPKPSSKNFYGTARASETKHFANSLGAAFFFSTQSRLPEKFENNLKLIHGADNIIFLGKTINDNLYTYAVVFSEMQDDKEIKKMELDLDKALSGIGGRLGVPSSIARNAAVF